MSFGQFKQFDGPIELIGVKGHKYVPPAITFQLGVKLKLYQEQVEEVQKVIFENLEAAKEAEKAGKEPPKPKQPPQYEWSEDEGPTPENMLGKKVLAAMKKNNEPHEMVEVATHTVWMDFLYGREVAEAFWNSGGDPKVVAEILYGSGKDHKIPLMSTSTEEESTTKKQASTNGTNSRKTSGKKSNNTTKNTPKKPRKSSSNTQK